MQVEKTIYRQWHLDIIPIGNQVWANGIGHLQGFGQSRRKLLLNEFVPHMVISGRGTYICQGQTIQLKAGDLFTVWPGLAYEFYEDPELPWQFYWFHLKGDGAEEFIRACGFGPDQLSLTPKYPERILDTLRNLFEYYDRPMQLRNPFHVLSLLYKLVVELKDYPSLNKDDLPVKTCHAIRVKEAMALAETLMDNGINVNELASRLGTSRNTLLIAFREQLHKTPLEYLSEIRLQRAENLLLRTKWKIAAISKACGFRNEKYFMRVFKKHHGMTPSLWRVSEMIS